MRTIAVLSRWWRRSSPPRSRLLASLGWSALGTLASLALLGGSGVLVVRATGATGLAALGLLLLGIELVALLRAPLRLRERLLAHRVALGSMVRWRAWLFDEVARRPAVQLQRSSAELLDRAIEDVDLLEDLYLRCALPALAAASATILAAAWIAASAPLAGLVVLVAGGAGLSIALVGLRWASRLELAAARARSGLAEASADLIAGMAELRMVDGAAAAIERVDAADRLQHELAGRRSRIRGGILAAEVAIVGLGILVALLVAGQGVSAGRVPVAAAAGIALLALAGLEPLAGLAGAALRAPEVAASALRLEEVEEVAVGEGDAGGGGTWPAGVPEISLRGVRARPVGSSQPVLSSVDLRLEPGSRTALLGASGAGKSTLAALLLRLQDLEGGVAAVGGVDLRSIPGDEVRRHVALLDQRPAIFGGTVRDALRLGDPQASDAAMADALRAGGLEGELGLDDRVGELGGGISGGQRQRLALARVLLRRPSLLILDEPTVGLDPVQAAAVVDAALEAAGDATVLLITHDLAEAARCDAVHWLADGRLRPIGPEELARLGP